MLSSGNYRVNVWLYVVTCVFVCNSVLCHSTLLMVDTQEWGLHILINNFDINLKYYSHTGAMRD